MAALRGGCRPERRLQLLSFGLFVWSRISRTIRPSVVGLYGFCRYWALADARAPFSESCEYPLVKRMGKSVKQAVSFAAAAVPPSLGMTTSRIAREGASFSQSLRASSPSQAERTR